LFCYFEFSSCVSLRISEGKGEEPLPRSACQLFGPPDVITAYRFDSLTRRLADDDMFSSDLTENELREKLGHVNVPCLLAISADDEYVPSSVDSTLLSHRMADAMAIAPTKGAKSVILASGGHGVRNAEGQTQFISASAVISRDTVFIFKSLHLLTSPNDNPKKTLYFSRVSAPSDNQQPQGAVSDFLSSLDHTLHRLDWETTLATDLLERLPVRPGRPLLVALSGMPGSGKSTTSEILKRLLHPQCFVVPLDA